MRVNVRGRLQTRTFVKNNVSTGEFGTGRTSTTPLFEGDDLHNDGVFVHIKSIIALDGFDHIRADSG